MYLSVKVSNLCHDQLLPPVFLITSEEINSPMLGLAVSSFITSIITTLLEENTLLISLTVSGIASHTCLSFSMLGMDIIRKETEHNDSELVVNNDEYLDAVSTPEDYVFLLRPAPSQVNTRTWTTFSKILFVSCFFLEMILLFDLKLNMDYLLVLGSNTVVLVIMSGNTMIYSTSVITTLCTQTVLLFITVFQIVALVSSNTSVLIIISIHFIIFMGIYIGYSIGHSKLRYTLKYDFIKPEI